ncbi:MAG TPA: nitroreductase [Micromonosporaceae bacterium]
MPSDSKPEWSQGHAVDPGELTAAGLSALSRRPSDLPAALAAAARLALRAPSVHNTQPWHWSVTGDHLELRADPRWTLSVADPDGRLMVLSCGAALHHVRVALHAMGYPTQVRRFSDSDRSTLLAEVTVGEPGTPTSAAADMLEAALRRRTDRRGVADRPVPEAVLSELRQAVAEHAVWLHVLPADQARRIVVAAEHADVVQLAEPDYRWELERWSRVPEGATAGVPEGSLPPRGMGYQTQGEYVVLYGNGDQPSSWLAAGEALSAVWLTATHHGVVVRPVSSVIEVPAGRAALHRVLSGMGTPYLVLHLGLPVDVGDVPQTPRRPESEAVDRPDPL